MDIKEIEGLIKIVSDSTILDFELESREYTIKMKKIDSITKKINLSNNIEQTKELNENVQSSNNIPETKESNNLYFIKSPIVGTFYTSSSPEAKPFVQKGSQIKKGDVLCIIEAMKLMNEIESDVDGTVVDIIANSGDMVEFGQPIFAIRLFQKIIKST